MACLWDRDVVQSVEIFAGRVRLCPAVADGCMNLSEKRVAHWYGSTREKERKGCLVSGKRGKGESGGGKSVTLSEFLKGMTESLNKLKESVFSKEELERCGCRAAVADWLCCGRICFPERARSKHKSVKEWI